MVKTAAVLLLLASVVSKPAKPDRLFFIGTLGKADVDVTIKLLPDGNVLGATLRNGNDLRSLRGSRHGDRLALQEFDAADHATARITARLSKTDLRGTWQKRRFDFWTPTGHETPLIYESSLSWPAEKRLHDAIRANDWTSADAAARQACGIRDDACAWLTALPMLARPNAHAAEQQPWTGLLLEREGKVREAIAADRTWCGGSYIVCLFLNDLAPQMTATEQSQLSEQLCEWHHIACDRAFGAAQVALSDAARAGDATTVDRLLKQGAAVNFGNRGRLLSPLLSACFAGSAAIVKQLLAHGADPNLDYGYETPLEFAVESNHDEITMLLLDYGAKPTTEKQNSVLWTAVYKKKHAIARKIIEKGGDVDDSVPAGSPLTAAVDNRDLEMVTLLLAHGANPEYEAKYTDGSPIDHARRTHQTAILKLLLAARKSD